MKTLIIEKSLDIQGRGTILLSSFSLNGIEEKDREDFLEYLSNSRFFWKDIPYKVINIEISRHLITSLPYSDKFGLNIYRAVSGNIDLEIKLRDEIYFWESVRETKEGNQIIVQHCPKLDSPINDFIKSKFFKVTLLDGTEVTETIEEKIKLVT